MLKELFQIKKWKDTARAAKEITKNYSDGKIVVIPENTLFVILKEMKNGEYLLSDSNPAKNQRRRYKLKIEDITIEEYADTRDINMQMLLADGWDAKDLLREEIVKAI